MGWKTLTGNFSQMALILDLPGFPGVLSDLPGLGEHGCGQPMK